MTGMGVRNVAPVERGSEPLNSEESRRRDGAPASPPFAKLFNGGSHNRHSRPIYTLIIRERSSFRMVASGTVLLERTHFIPGEPPNARV